MSCILLGEGGGEGILGKVRFWGVIVMVYLESKKLFSMGEVGEGFDFVL